MANKKSNRIVNYFKEVKSELKKVVWPGFKQVKNNTLIVIACILIIGIFICAFDFLFDISLGAVIDKLQGTDAVEETTDTDTVEQELSDEEIAAYLQSVVEPYGFTYDAETKTYKDADGKEYTDEEVMAIIEAANAESADTADESSESADKDAE